MGISGTEIGDWGENRPQIGDWIRASSSQTFAELWLFGVHVHSTIHGQVWSLFIECPTASTILPPIVSIGEILGAATGRLYQTGFSAGRVLAISLGGYDRYTYTMGKGDIGTFLSLSNG